MNKGIEVLTGGSGWSAACVIQNNYIKGIDNVGIDLREIGSATNCLVSNNFITNLREVSSSMIGIEGRGNYTVMVGNYIIYPGSIGIDKASQVIGNVIFGNTSTTSTLYAINLDGGTNKIAVGNFIYNVSGIGINGGDSSNCLISNNMLLGASALTVNGISDIGEYSIVSGNFIQGYGTSGTSIISISNGASEVIISNNMMYDVVGSGISCGNANMSNVVGNFIKSDGISGESGIYNFNEYSVISNNIISGMAEAVGTWYGIRSSASAGKCLISGNLLTVPGSNMDTAISLQIDIHQLVSGNVIISTPHKGIDLNGGSWNSVVGNFILGVGDDVTGEHLLSGVGNAGSIVGNFIRLSNDNGISVSGNSILISGNYIIDTEDQGVFTGGEDCTVVGNFIYTTGEDGIVVSGTRTLISSNTIRSSQGSGVEINGVSGVCVTGNFIYNSTGAHGIECTGGGTTDLVITNNYIDNMANEGITLNTTCDRSFVSGNYIRNCGFGIRVNASGEQVCVSNNFIMDTTIDGIKFDTISDDVSIIGNHIKNVAGTARVGISHSGQNGFICGNHVNGTSGDGIVISASSNQTLITSNRVEDAGGDGIVLNGCDDISVVGNYIDDTSSGQVGINLIGSSTCLLVGNFADGVSGQEAFAIDTPSPGGMVAAGNIAHGGNPPTGFGSGFSIDSVTCRLV